MKKLLQLWHSWRANRRLKEFNRGYHYALDMLEAGKKPVQAKYDVRPFDSGVTHAINCWDNRKAYHYESRQFFY